MTVGKGVENMQWAMGKVVRGQVYPSDALKMQHKERRREYQKKAWKESV